MIRRFEMALPLLGFMLVSCDMSLSGSCEYEIVQEIQSPDIGLKAAVVSAECGATQGFVRQVLLTAILREFDFERDEVAVIDGGYARIAWEGSLLKVFHSESRPVHKVCETSGIQIVYLDEE